jgi:hypothetical protein
MRAAVRKLRVEDVEKLQALVVDNFDAIEPGLTVLDARLLLGHATIDVIGVDSVGALVLGSVGFSANEDMLLKAVEAYSWCLEYPEALVRLYPSCRLSEERPPRLLFVVERMPDAFHRKIKQLGFPEVDCVEFRHLEFDGVPAVYFESLLNLRRGVATRSAPSAPPDAAGPAENVIAMGGGSARSGGTRLPRFGQPSVEAPTASPRAADRALPPREPAGVVSMVSRQTAVPAPRAEPSHEPQPPVVDPDAVSLAAPELERIATLPEAVATPEPFIEPEPAFEPPAAVDAMTATQEALAHTPGDAGAKPAIAEPLVLESALTAPGPSEPIVTSPALELDTAIEPVAEPQAVVTPAEIEDVVELAVETLESKAPVQAERPITETGKPAAPAMPQGFEGLKFPNDGVLTRQWMEFLSQMSTTK